MLELALQLPPRLGRRAAIEAALRDAIRTGRLEAGTRLPSSRVLASDLGVARSTVVSAYEQLTAEGFLISEHGRATTVAATPSLATATPADDLMGSNPIWDLRPGEPDVDSFPRREWLRSVRRVLSEDLGAALHYSDPRGHPRVRSVLSHHVSRTRAVIADPNSIFMCGGFASGLGFMADMFRQLAVTTVGVETGMLPFHRAILRAAGLTVVSIAVDESGLVVDELARTEAGAVVVTPANNFPYAVTMAPERRNQLVDWAEAVSGWVVEDDYDGEFRYDRRPIGALQALAPGRVFYSGTVSKSLAPGLRLGWLVVPETMRAPLLRAAGVRGWVSTIDQLALADFIEAGRLDRHVRSARRKYRQRRDELTAFLESTSGSLSVAPCEAGLHLRVDLGSASEERTTLERADAVGVGVLGLHTHLRVPEDHAGLAIGFSRPPDHQYRAAIAALGKALSGRDAP